MDQNVIQAAGAVLFWRRDANAAPVFLLLQNARHGSWGFPKGHRDAGESLEDCAAREVDEETGYTGLTLAPGFRAEIDYLVRDDGGEPYSKRVVYFLAEAPDSEPVLSHEHQEHCWADAAGIERLLRFGQLRDLAQEALRAVTNS